MAKESPFDDTKIDIPCPYCWHQNVRTLGWVRDHAKLTCERCVKEFDFDNSKALDAITKNLDEYGRKLGKPT